MCDGEDAVDWLERNPSARGEDVLQLPTTVAGANVVESDVTVFEPETYFAGFQHRKHR